MSEESNSWPRWQVAVAIGVPVGVVTVAIGCTVYYCWWRKAPPPDGSQDPTGSRKQPDSPVTSNSVTGNAINTDESHDPVVAKNPLEQAQDSKAKGNKYFKGRKYDSALKCYQEAARVCPSDNSTELSTYYQNMAACYEHMAAAETSEELKETYHKYVIRTSTEAIKLNSKYVKAYQRRSRSNEQLKMYRDCLRDLTAVMLLDPKQLEFCQEKCNDVVKVIVEERIKQDYPEGKQLEHLSHTFVFSYHESFCYHGYVDKDHLEEVWLQLEHVPNGSHDLSTGSHDADNTVVCSDSIEQQPLVTAVKEFHACNYGNVIPLCTNAIESGHPGLVPMAMLLRGEMQYLWQQRQLALDDLQAVVNMPQADTKERISALLQRSYILADEIESLEAARHECELALELDSCNSDTFVQLAKISMLAGEGAGMEQAMNHFEKALRLDPNNHVATVNYAYMQFRFGAISNSMQMVESSRQHFVEAMNKFPKQPEVFVLYGQMLQDCMQIDEAIQMFQKAIKLQPKVANTYVYQGLLHFMAKKDVAGAVEVVNHGLRADPYCMLVYMTLGSLELQRNVTMALQMLDKAIEVSHTKADLVQAYSVRELAVIQQAMCDELGIDPLEVMAQQTMGPPV